MIGGRVCGAVWRMTPRCSAKCSSFIPHTVTDIDDIDFSKWKKVRNVWLSFTETDAGPSRAVLGL